MDWSDRELIGFDLETTGPDPRDAVPVSYALTTFVGRRIASLDSCLVDPGVAIPPGATAIHGVTTERCHDEGLRLDDAVAHLCHALLDAAARDVPVVGMNLCYDLTIVERLGASLGHGGLRSQGWTGPALDVLVLDRHFDPYRKGRRKLADLCAHYGVVLEGAHEAGADAAASVEVLFRICDKTPAFSSEPLAKLHQLQVTWQKEWATSNDQWRVANALPRLESGAFDWPFSL